MGLAVTYSAITSQNGTAPKQCFVPQDCQLRAITSQNGTAPKHNRGSRPPRLCAITSQNGTAPKRTLSRDSQP